MVSNTILKQISLKDKHEHQTFAPAHAWLCGGVSGHTRYAALRSPWMWRLYYTADFISGTQAHTYYAKNMCYIH